LAQSIATVKRVVYRHRRPIAVVLYVGLSWGANVSAFLVRFDGQVAAKEWAAQWAWPR